MPSCNATSININKPRDDHENTFEKTDINSSFLYFEYDNIHFISDISSSILHGHSTNSLRRYTQFG